MTVGGIHTVALETQVGGHAGVLTTEDGSLLIKPALKRELEFYQRLQSDSSLEILRPYIPKFLGTLKLEGTEGVSGVNGDGAAVSAVSVKKDEFGQPNSIVLENISYQFLKPNVLDIKLGTVLYDDEASPQKIERMKETARRTTSLETGVRLTGFQVYDNVSGLSVNTPKSYGKSIKPADLPEGIARFFPVGTRAGEGGAEKSSSGLPASLLLPILKGIHEDVQEIREAFASVELRTVGGSLLVVYEGDWNRAEEALKYCDFANDEDDAGEGEGAEKKPGPPFTVKLIDFAHTKTAPGQGPDEGVLLGFDTVLRLLAGRIEQVAAA